MKRMNRYKFKLEIIGIDETAEKAWPRALTAYYLHEMRGKEPPAMPDYEDLGMIPGTPGKIE